jgi:hypothetical protein
VDGANAVEKDADLEVEEDADEEVSQQDEEDPQPVEDAGEVDDEPADTEGEGDDDEDPEQDLETNEVENEQENNIDENEEEPLPGGDLEDQEIELQPAHRAEALDVLASVELEFAILREWVYVEKMEILAWEDSMVQACKFPVQFIPANSLSLILQLSIRKCNTCRKR